MGPEKVLKRFLESAKSGKKSRIKRYLTKTSQQKEIDISRLSELFNNHAELEVLNKTELYNGGMCDIEFKIKEFKYKVRLVKEKIAFQIALDGQWGVNPYSFKTL